MFKQSIATSAAIIVSAVSLGCSGDFEESESGADGALPPVATTDEAGRDVTGLNLGAPSTTYPLPERGGTGGSPAPSLTGSVIYGMRLNTGRLVDNISLAYYVPSQADNIYRSGDFYSVLGPLGGTGGTWHDWTYCPPDFGAIGIQGRAADKVDALGLICVNLRDSSQIVTLPVYGGSGGQGFNDRCGQGYLMTGVNLRTGRVVDRVQGMCQRAR